MWLYHTRVQPHFGFSSSHTSWSFHNDKISWTLLRPLTTTLRNHLLPISPFPSFLLNQPSHILTSWPLLILPAHQHSSFAYFCTQPTAPLELAVSMIQTPSPLPIFRAVLEKVVNIGIICSTTRRRPNNLSSPPHLWLSTVHRSTASQTFSTPLHPNDASLPT